MRGAFSVSPSKVRGARMAMAAAPQLLSLLLPVLLSGYSAEGISFAPRPSSFAPAFRFSVEPTDVVVKKDRAAAALHCSTVDSAAVVRWRRNGEFLRFPDFNDRRRLLSNGTLYFSTVLHSRTNRPDEGMYQCVATLDGVGTIVSRTAELKVAGISAFDVQPNDQAVYLGQTAAFACSAPSFPPATVTWLKDEQPLQLDHARMALLPSGTLTIAAATLSDRATYRCRLENEAEQRESRDAKLKINLDMASAGLTTPPEFILAPSNTVLESGSTATLDCAANGNPTPQITWLKDGATVDLLSLENGRFARVGAGSLRITDVRVEDAGVYQCRSENAEDSVDAAAALTVQVRPTFAREPVDARARVTNDVELPCEVRGVPTPAVQWYKNGELLVESEYFQIVHGTNLKILGVVEKDTGVYQCVASNPVGNVQASAQLIVDPKETSPASPNDLAPDLDSKSQSTPNYRQMQSTAEAEKSSLGSIAASLLHKTPSTPSNVDAVIVSTRFVTLSWDRPDSTNGDVEGYSVFYKEAGSDRERVLNATSGSLQELNVQGLQPASAYEFRVVAHNQHGIGESSQPLRITTQEELDVPGPVSDLKARPTSSFSILINWNKPVYSSSYVRHYKLYYRQSDDSEVKSVTVNQRQHHLSELREYTEYTFWVSAFNANGEGAFSAEVVARTHSDVPADPPVNVTAEAASSRSLIVRWEPPPKESQNGVITGYKLRWRKHKRGRSQVVTTDGSRRLYAIAGLDRGTAYQVKIAAMTVNGSGPATPWMEEVTYAADLDESAVPDTPSSLKAKAKDDEIAIEWTPPVNNRILLRGYKIGWGKGIPDEVFKLVDDSQRSFVIRGLSANSEYIITLRAYNNIGDGRPRYETMRTKEENADDFAVATPLATPYNVHARILSSKTSLVTWSDSTLPRNQLIPDNRYYIVRYTTSKSLRADKPRHQYRNSSDLNVMLDDLRPNTEYELVVKVVKGRRQSMWSMVTVNRTEEAAPGSPPRDLSIRYKDDTLLLSWRAPKYPNGGVNGYVIQYTVDRRAEDREWFVEAVVGDVTSAVIRNVEKETKYFFKMSARNSKGYGPSGSIITYTTGRAGSSVFSTAASPSPTSSSNSDQNSDGVSPVVLYAVAGVGAGIIIVVVIGAVIVVHRCTKNQHNGNQADRNKAYLGGELGQQREKLNPSSASPGAGGMGATGPPPDLWIGHVDQLELKAMDDGDETGETSIRSASSMAERSRQFGLPYSGIESESEVSFSLTSGSICRSGIATSSARKKHFLRPPSSIATGASSNAPLLSGHSRQIKVAAINGKPRVQRYLSHESVASSVPTVGGSSCNGSSSTYIRSQFTSNLCPPSNNGAVSGLTGHSIDDLPPPGYAPSEGPPSTIGDLAAVTTSSVDGGSVLGIGGAQMVPPPQLPPTYLSSAMSTSSGDSSSASGSGQTRTSRQSSSNQSSSASNSGTALKSFSSLGHNHAHKNIVRPQPTSPFKRPLLTGFSGSNIASADGSVQQQSTPMHSGQLPSLAEVRSPEVLQQLSAEQSAVAAAAASSAAVAKNNCDCLSHPIRPSLSTEELNAEMKNLEGLMKDLNSISRPSTLSQYPC